MNIEQKKSRHRWSALSIGSIADCQTGSTCQNHSIDTDGSRVLRVVWQRGRSVRLLGFDQFDGHSRGFDFTEVEVEQRFLDADDVHLATGKCAECCFCQ